MKMPSTQPHEMDSAPCLAVLDPLEDRLLLAAAEDMEQYMLELINRARANPAAEAVRWGIDLNEGLTPGTISTAAKQPLTLNQYLLASAEDHTVWLMLNNLFQHEGPGGNTPQQRMAAAGYVFVAPAGAGENLAYRASTAPVANYMAVVSALHGDLFVDAGVAGRGHRLNIMNPSYGDIGIGIGVGPFTTSGTTYDYTTMVTQDFAYTGTTVYLTGVAYSDLTIDDNFYTPGEGYSGAQVVATRVSDGAVFQTTTIATGGYSLALPAGTYTVTASSGGLPAAVTYQNVVVGAQNVKVDFTPPQSVQIYPANQNAIEDIALILTGANKQIILADTTGQATAIQVSLTAGNGTMTLSRLTGLTFTAGTGVGDTAMTFRGTLADVNAALNGMGFRGTTDYNGAATLRIVSTAITPGGNTALGDHTVNLTVLAVNDAPSFAKGLDQNVLEDVGLVTVPGWATGISPGPANEASQTVSFSVTNNNTALFTVQPAISANGTLTYTPKANTAGTVTVTVYAVDNGGTANGGDNTSDAQTFTITVAAVNDAPVNTVPAAQTAGQEAALVFSQVTGNRILVSDPDAGASPLRVTLTAPDGILTLGSTAGVTVTGNGTGTLIVTGSATAINTALNGLTFHGGVGFIGATTLTIVTDDQGATGSGGAQTDTDVIDITVTEGRQLILDGRLPVRFVDATGDTVTVHLIGGTGIVFLPPGDQGDIRQIVLSNTTDRSMLRITGRTTVGDITVNGPLGTLSAALATLTGTLSIGPATTAFGATTITLDRLVEAQITSQMPVGSLIAAAWTDADGTPDVLTAPRARNVMIRGQMQADLDLLGATDRLNKSLGGFMVIGAFEGHIRLAGGAGAMTVGNWAVGSLDGLFVSSIISRGSLGAAINLDGDNRGASMNLLSVTGGVSSPSISLAGIIRTITAGFWNVADFQAVSASSVIVRGDFSGAFTLSGQNAAGSSLLVLSVMGSINNAVVWVTGSINSVLAGSMIDSTIFAGIRQGVVGLPAAEADFLDPLNPLRPIAINVFRISKPLGQVSNSLLAAPVLGTVMVRNVQYNAGTTPWGIAADEVIRLLMTYNTGQPTDIDRNIRESLATVGKVEVRIV